jgi:O-succinylhomoserine sulfhydrylase
MKDSKHFETRAIRTQMERSQYKEHSAPIHLTSSYLFDSADHAEFEMHDFELFRKD